MGMDSKKLSERKKQPGNDQTFRASEKNFVDSASRALDPTKYVVTQNPDDLSDLFGRSEATKRALGIDPEASVTSISTGRKIFFEVKKQGNQGNAEERAYKHHTVQFYKTLKEKYNYNYHPYVTIFCEALAYNERYTAKFPFLLEEYHYFLWKDYDEGKLSAFLKELCSKWLDDP